METNGQDDRVLRLEEELKGVKKSFEVLLLAIEAEGVVAAAEIADRLAGRLETMMIDIKSVYVELVFEKRFQSLSHDHQRLGEIKASERPSADSFIELVSRMEKHISTVEREMAMFIPRQQPFVVWFRKHGKKAGLVAAAACVIVGIGAGIQSFTTRGKGLTVEYYEGSSFGKLVRKSRDLKIDFELNGRGPARGVRWDNISVRWTGVLKVPTDGDYEFLTRSDDGARLMIDGERLIDNWTIHRPAIDKATKNLTAGPHAIQVEWFQARGAAMMKLYWRGSNDAQPRIIESEFFSPN